MLQPFELLQPVYVERLEALNKTLLVTQSYARGAMHNGGGGPVSLVVSAYDDEGLAKTHLNAIKTDRYAAIIDIARAAHKKKLYEMIQGNEYIVYWAVVRSAAAFEKTINARYRDNMRRYIEQNTNWRVNVDTNIRPTVQLIFGELYVNLKHGSQTLRIKFSDVELS